MWLNRNAAWRVFIRRSAGAVATRFGDENLAPQEMPAAARRAQNRLESIADELNSKDGNLIRLRALLMHWAAEDPVGLSERLALSRKKG
jgi:hypothetical protein